MPNILNIRTLFKLVCYYQAQHAPLIHMPPDIHSRRVKGHSSDKVMSHNMPPDMHSSSVLEVIVHKKVMGHTVLPYPTEAFDSNLLKW